mmetsp:Transcript_50457/g.161505  ORF Transcript_50457/g.161505 Transcript_50457/m.161505 type:complete len:670 (-) Transcript_50457:171-2180(-)
MASRGQLVQFLANEGKVDQKVIAYMTNQMKLTSVSDFANYFTSSEFEKGVQDDIVAQVSPFNADVSKPDAKIQTARLRAAWKAAQTGANAIQATGAAPAPSTKVVGMGWTSQEITTTDADGLFEALVYKARNPAKFMDVSDVTVVDRPGFLARTMIIKATNKRVEEHIYARERQGEMVYRVVDSTTKRETDDERVIAVKESPLRLEFFHRHVTDGYRAYWQTPLEPVEQMFRELIDIAGNLANASEVVGLGVRSPAIAGVSHDSLWRAMLESIREPSRFFNCSDVSIKDCRGFVQRTLSANGVTYTENICDDEASCEIVYRKVENGVEADLERVVALRTHPLQIEFHQRSKADGFRVQWDMPKSAPLSTVDAFVREAKRMDSTPPTTIGYGITSDPIRGCSYDSLLIAIQATIKQPWKAIDVDRTACEVKDCNGYVERKMTLKATGECVLERVTVNEEIGEVTYNKCGKDGQPSNVERVLAIHTPLRLEFYERNVSDGMRLNWQAPYAIARQTFENIIKLAKQLEKNTSDVIGYGLASKPISGATQDSVWKAMLYSVRNPAESGLKVDNVTIRDMPGYMQRSMRLLDMPGTPTVTDNVRVIESAQEITYRPVKGRDESEEERVFAIRTDPLRLEMFSRHSKDEMRFEWLAPRSVANDVFNSVTSLAQRM